VPNEQEVGRAPEGFWTVAEKLRGGLDVSEKKKLLVDLCQKSNANSLVAQHAV
jgi:hypothetical protein